MPRICRPLMLSAYRGSQRQLGLPSVIALVTTGTPIRLQSTPFGGDNNAENAYTNCPGCRHPSVRVHCISIDVRSGIPDPCGTSLCGGGRTIEYRFGPRHRNATEGPTRTAERDYRAKYGSHRRGSHQILAYF